MMLLDSRPVILFDTTLRDGELMTGVSFDLQQKLELALLLEAIGVDVIEAGYPGYAAKDFEALVKIAQQLKTATVCGLASSNPTEIERVAEALKPARRSRIHTYTNVNLKGQSRLDPADALAVIQQSVSLCRNYSEDVEWSAFDAPRSDRSFLCQAIEVAIASGATTVSIPDSMGLLSPEQFSALLTMIFHQVPNLDRAVVSVHCHDDLSWAVANSIAALECGARQIECSINGLGARKGNADLREVVTQIQTQPGCELKIDTALLQTACDRVAHMTGVEKKLKDRHTLD